MTPLEIINAARLAADIMLALVPHDAAKDILSDAAVRRANLAADAAALAKFGTLDEDADTEPTP